MPGIDETENSFRYRIQTPDDFDESTLRTIDIDAEGGIKAVVGKLKKANKLDDPQKTQSYIFDKSKWTEDKVKDWLTKHKLYQSDELETVRIELEIFSTGTQKGQNISVADLEEIVKATNEFRNDTGNEPYNKISHEDGNPILDNMALGWVDKLYVKGQKLMAECYQVPKKFAQMIQSGAFKKRSIELYNALTHKGIYYGKVLKAIAHFGTNIPEVSNLNDAVTVIYSADNYKTEFYSLDSLSEGKNEKEQKMETPENNAPSTDDVKDKKIKEQEEIILALREELKKKNSEYEMAVNEKTDMAKKVEAYQAEIKSKAFSSFKTRMIDEKRFTPAEIEKFEKSEKNPLSADNYTQFETLMDESRPKNFLEKYTQESFKDSVNNSADDKSEAMIDQLAQKYAKDNNVSYPQALMAVKKRSK
jgi:hypothetical protein